MIDRHSEGGLRAHSITVGYGKDSPILEGLSLDVLQGELTVIVAVAGTRPRAQRALRRR